MENKNYIQGSEYFNQPIKKMWADYELYILDIKKKCKNTPNKVKQNRKNNSLDINSNKNNHKLCDKLDEAKEWLLWIEDVSNELMNIPINTVAILCKTFEESYEYAKNIISKGIEYCTNWLSEKLKNLITNNKWVKKIIKKIKSISLYIKKSILIAKLEVYKIMKKVLSFAMNGKLTNFIEKTITAIMKYIEKICEYIDKALIIIENILSSLIGLTLDGGCMGFFSTPKTIMAGNPLPDPYTTMNPTNINQQIMTNIDDTFIKPIEDEIEKLDLSKKTTEIGNVIVSMNNAINSTISNLDNEDDITIPNVDVKLSKDDIITTFKNALNILLTTLLQPEPLPKYERLHPANLGFLIWLITSFEPTMKKCFGLPTYP